MSEEENEDTPHAIPVYTTTRFPDPRLERLFEDLQEATVDVRSRIRIGEPEVTIPVDTATRLANGVEEILGTLRVQERQSLSSLYIGTLLGVLIGVLGNFFVSFWFSIRTSWNLLGLSLSGILLLVVSIALLYQARKFAT